MVKKIVWTKRALKKFDEIIDYLEIDWGSNVTRNFVTRTYSIIELLATHPQLGTMEKPESNIRGFLLTKQQVILQNNGHRNCYFEFL